MSETMQVSQTQLHDVQNHIYRYENANLTRKARNTAALKLASDIYSINAGSDPWLTTGPVFDVRVEDIDLAYQAAVRNDTASDKESSRTEKALVKAARTLLEHAQKRGN